MFSKHILGQGSPQVTASLRFVWNSSCNTGFDVAEITVMFKGEFKDKLLCQDKMVRMVWTPGHFGVANNDKMNDFVKEG